MQGERPINALNKITGINPIITYRYDISTPNFPRIVVNSIQFQTGREETISLLMFWLILICLLFPVFSLSVLLFAPSKSGYHACISTLTSNLSLLPP
jgi:hypothetical protein